MGRGTPPPETPPPRRLRRLDLGPRSPTLDPPLVEDDSDGDDNESMILMSLSMLLHYVDYKLNYGLLMEDDWLYVFTYLYMRLLLLYSDVNPGLEK